MLLGPIGHEVGLVRVWVLVPDTANDALVSSQNHANLVGVVKATVLPIQTINHLQRGDGFLGMLENLENEVGTFASLPWTRKVVALLTTELLVAQFLIPSQLMIGTAPLAGYHDGWKMLKVACVNVVTGTILLEPSLVKQLTVVGTVILIIPEKKLKLNGFLPIANLTHSNQNNVFCSPSSMSSGPSGSGSKRGAVASATKMTSRSTSGFHT